MFCQEETFPFCRGHVCFAQAPAYGLASMGRMRQDLRLFGEVGSASVGEGSVLHYGTNWKLAVSLNLRLASGFVTGVRDWTTLPDLGHIAFCHSTQGLLLKCTKLTHVFSPLMDAKILRPRVGRSVRSCGGGQTARYRTASGIARYDAEDQIACRAGVELMPILMCFCTLSLHPLLVHYHGLSAPAGCGSLQHVGF